MGKINCTKNLFRIFVFSALSALFLGCGGSSPNTPNLPVTKQFRFDGISNFELRQLHNATIVYHTAEEIEALLNEKITKFLVEKRLLTSDENANILEISLVYFKRFMGDETPVKSDSLGYPLFGYNIKVLDNNQTILREIDRRDLIFKGGFATNVKALAGQLREKEDELQFIDAFAETVTKSIEKIK
ncbi:MAG: hypothetical protein LBP54_07310 [Campylobacteraceae bacterium]|jgi:hypothetical protein|nr:hypothetical protein [Campylobacteraceae bacterium]